MPAAPVPSPPVHLGRMADDSLTPAVFAIVRAGVAARPELAAMTLGTILLRFIEDYPSVRIDLRGHEVEVSDDLDGDDRAVDLVVTGRLGDINALLASPLAGGLPKPTNPRGRKALGRLADGRVDFDGPLGLGRKMLMLLTLEDALPTRRTTRARARDRQG